LYLSATIVPGCDGELIAHTMLRSRSDPARQGLPAREDLHFTADVRLRREPLAPPAALAFPVPTFEQGVGVRTIEHDQIYRVYFHGPVYQVLERAQIAGDRAIGLMARDLPPDLVLNLQTQQALPVETHCAASLQMAPRLIELCFQTAGLWEMAARGVMALPLALESVTTYRQPNGAASRLYALVDAIDGGVSFDARVVDEDGNLYVELKGYRTVQLPGHVEL
jgi:hypothetical protein